MSVLQFLIRMSLELPPETSDLMAGWSSNPLPGAVDPLALVHSTWALEAFIDVSPCIPPRLPPCSACVQGSSNAGNCVELIVEHSCLLDISWLGHLRLARHHLSSDCVQAEQLHRMHKIQDAVPDLRGCMFCVKLYQ